MLRFPSVYVEIHFEFFVLLCAEHLCFDSSTGQNRRRSDCNTGSSNGRTSEEDDSWMKRKEEGGWIRDGNDKG